MRIVFGASREDARIASVPARSVSHVRRRWRAPGARHVRWLVAGAAVVSLWACGSPRLAVPDPNPALVVEQSFRQQVNHKIDLLFMIDDSHSMASLQKKMSDQLGT